MWRRTLPLVIVALAACTSGGCRTVDQDRELRAGLAEVLANAPMSPALERALGALPLASSHAVVWDDVRSFYRQRDLRPAWVTQSGLTPQAATAIQVIGQAPDHGFRIADYDVAGLIDRSEALGAASVDDPRRAQALVAFETRLTAALLALGRDVAFGRTNPQLVNSLWRARRASFDLPGRLATIADRNPAGWLDEVRPTHPEYAALQQALVGLDDSDEMALVAMNLERWRWMPDDLSERYVLINIPEYRLLVYEDGGTALDSRVIVGRKGRETPVFSGMMTTVVLSPYWHIPDTIAAGETVPAMVRDRSYLSRNHIDVLRITPSGTVPVDPATVDWDNPAATRDLVFRQRPGADNALGHVKFLLPNPYAVYLHDTPADDLFAHAGRALSHGCVRVEEALALAEYVLRDDPRWDDVRIRDAMRAGVERSVTLETPLPVHIVYFTTTTAADGQLQVWPDVYGYDERQRRAVGAR